ncbi:GNAT family N-acetyltransferase [Allokutzneria sp. NRRL B-24872]|uniref:GNAT family N-acetyltransferase n=1 Tax=Allokutzneria sp. NRRL B-24872 TaxID=1137961 RepID=UPI000A35D674|nr:GNAT family protein [Allokutzneria sp. NRRL B-24872]
MLTERLALRQFRRADAEVVRAYRSDPEVARYQSWEAPLSTVDAEELVAEFAALDPDEPGWFQYAVELRDCGELIGDVGVNLHENRMQAEIGFTFARRHQGRGHATEAVSRVVDHLLVSQGLRRVSAECDARNTASARLLERVGFRQEGHRPEFTWLKGEWTDDLLFGLLARDWPASAAPVTRPPAALARAR